MAKIKIVSYLLPEFYAGYLINGDIDNYTDIELNAIDNFIKNEKLNNCINVDFENVSFYKYHDLTNYGVLAGNCCIYDFIK